AREHGAGREQAPPRGRGAAVHGAARAAPACTPACPGTARPPAPRIRAAGPLRNHGGGNGVRGAVPRRAPRIVAAPHHCPSGRRRRGPPGRDRPPVPRPPRNGIAEPCGTGYRAGRLHGPGPAGWAVPGAGRRRRRPRRRAGGAARTAARPAGTARPLRARGAGNGVRPSRDPPGAAPGRGTPRPAHRAATPTAPPEPRTTPYGQGVPMTEERLDGVIVATALPYAEDPAAPAGLRVD